MSFDLAVWHTTKRLTNEQATALWRKERELRADSVVASPAVDAFYAELTSKHPDLDTIPKEQADNTELCPWSVAIDRSPGQLIMCATWPRAAHVRKLVHSLARKHGLAVYDPQLARVFYPTGRWDFTFSVEGNANLESPSTDDIRAAVRRMTPNGGPGFVILEGRDNDYAQAAGGDGAFTVEWREYLGKDFRHWKAGRRGQTESGDVAIPNNRYVVRVRSNERLRAKDVEAILLAYLAGHGRPKEYVWRDMTNSLS